MGSFVRYYPGGFNAGAPQQNRAELYDGAANAYTAWDTSGTVTATRALTAAESANLAAMDTANTQDGNRQTLQAQAQTALLNNRTYLAIGSPTNAEVTAQVRALTQQHQALIRFALGQFDATN